MKVIIELRPYSDHYLVWQEGVTATVGPIMSKMVAKECYSKEELLELLKTLLPEVKPPKREGN